MRLRITGAQAFQGRQKQDFVADSAEVDSENFGWRIRQVGVSQAL